MLSPRTRRHAGILLVVLPTVIYGGASLLYRLNSDPRYAQNHLRQDLWLAGHAHAGVLLLLSLVTLLYLDDATLSARAKTFVRITDLPGFGNTIAPLRGQFSYTFDNLAQVIGKFVQAIGLTRFAMYVFDYGAPTGFRLALAHPERIAAIITQNGNAYMEGFSDAWTVWQNYWKHPTPENREVCRESLSPDFIRNIQYLQGADPQHVSPDGYTLDIAYMSRPGAEALQLDLILDYRSNPAMYPAFQKYFREHQPPTLASWGKNAPHFLPAGAEAYRRDNPGAKVVFYDTGHFVLETHAVEIGQEICAFLSGVFAKDDNKRRDPTAFIKS